jgi:hypothetical protein
VQKYTFLIYCYYSKKTNKKTEGVFIFRIRGIIELVLIVYSIEVLSIPCILTN